MVWPSMSHTTWSSWEEEMEEALHNLDIELGKVEQRMILQEGTQEVRELVELDYSKDDLSIVASDANSDSMTDTLLGADEKSHDVFVHRRMIRGKLTNDSEDEFDEEEDSGVRFTSCICFILYTSSMSLSSNIISTNFYFVHCSMNLSYLKNVKNFR